jgi:hypothetical protein
MSSPSKEILKSFETIDIVIPSEKLLEAFETIERIAPSEKLFFIYKKLGKLYYDGISEENFSVSHVDKDTVYCIFHDGMIHKLENEWSFPLYFLDAPNYVALEFYIQNYLNEKLLDKEHHIK